jgi:hypothetical protein
LAADSRAFKIFSLFDEDDVDYEDELYEPDEKIRKTKKSLQIPQFLRGKSKGFFQKEEKIHTFLETEYSSLTFSKMVTKYIAEQKLTTKEIYHRCLIDRKLISKITVSDQYHPTKETVLKLCIAFRLNLEKSEELLSLAGYSLNHTVYDLLYKYMFINHIYDLDLVNEILIHFEQPYIK